MLDTPRYSPGEPVEVWSNTTKAWVPGRIEEVVKQAGVIDGYSAPDGCIKVSSAVGVKYILHGDAPKLLKPHATAGSNGPVSGGGAAASSSMGPPQRPPRGSFGSGGSGKRVRPTSRQQAGLERLEARDRWNTYEIKLQEVFMEYDRDRSGSLEQEEFRELLRDFNAGRPPTDEEYGFMIKLCDKDFDGKISLGELHYALRAWNSYQNLDCSVLRLFAAFDTDSDDGVNPEHFQSLLTAMNGGILVPMQEVLSVIEQADVNGDGALNRSELLGAIACWYTQVSRHSTDVFTLMQEAASRAAHEGSQPGAFRRGVRGIGHAATTADGYSPVRDSGDAELSPPRSESIGDLVDSLQGGSMVSRSLPSRASKAIPQFVRSMGSLCYAGSPFLLGWAMAIGGWHQRVNKCPRNLDGILLWFGLLVLVLSSLNYVHNKDPIVERAQLALAVMLAGLSMIGLLWTLDVNVQENEDLCGPSLVWWSKFTWLAIPTCGCGYACYTLAWQMRRLRHKDAKLQHEIIL